MTDWEDLAMRSMGGALEPDWREPSLQRIDGGFRSKRDQTVSWMPEKPRQPRVREAKEKRPSRQKPLQENTISSSLKPEETKRGREAHQKAANTSGTLRNESPEGTGESRPSRSPSLKRENLPRDLKGAVDFSNCNGHDSVPSQSLVPRPKKIKLEMEEDPCVPAEDNRGLARQQAKKVSAVSELDSGAPSNPEQANFRATEEAKMEKKKEKGLKKSGKERREPPVKEEVGSGEWEEKGLPDRESDSEEISRRILEAEEGVRRLLGEPCEVGSQEKGSEEEKPKKKKKRKADVAEEAERRRTGKKAEKGSQKRKAKDGGKGGKKKRPKKEDREPRKSSEEEDGGKWKWWEEEKREDGVKWQQLEHSGPFFAPPYEPLPDDVRFYYNGKPMKLSLAAEEIATFYAKMLDHDYTRKHIFQNNFFNDWTKEMTPEERKKIKELGKCNFDEIHQYFVEKHEAHKALAKEEKQKLKQEAERIQEKYGYCMIDGHREKIGNFKTEPPGLFRGRGDHPKMGMLKKRILPEDIIINCSRDSLIPPPPPGHKWKEVRCDNTVTWLACWTENIQGSIKYVMLNPSSKLKGEKDWQKYEVARRLKEVVSKIRSQYRADWKSKEMKKRQRSVALYFIDKLALRAGNEKEEGETADTVGCCSLRVEHLMLHPRLDGKENVVEFDFLGKDCIRYYNKVPVEKQVFKNLQLFMENKDPGEDLFDRLSTTSLNKHLQDLMDGLTAKVFRTYNASITLQEQLRALTNEDDNVAAKMLSYNRANRAVAVLCNHQRATPKTFEKSMQNLQAKIDAKKDQLADAKAELKRAKADHKTKKDVKSKAAVEKKKKLVEKIEEQLSKLSMQATDKEENKQIALGTSKLNYLDPRISVAWCKKFDVPIEKIYNKTQREKFAWAIAMADEDFEF
ncbi:DNA topoisomerase I, mitochondrial isoform X2 [Paroedura picta]|uniref:DNA topoisomerase I, mitochondrial isoform X2 n=1 Tax=Paroedura picta TaxID=143630 RepID=UPI0040559F67